MKKSVQQKLLNLGLGTTHTTVANVLLENHLLESPAPDRAESALGAGRQTVKLLTSAARGPYTHWRVIIIVRDTGYESGVPLHLPYGWKVTSLLFKAAL